MIRFYAIVILFLAVTFWSYGQIISEYPETFQLYSHMIPNQDPLFLKDHKIRLGANYLNYIGTFSEVRQISAQVGFKIKDNNRLGLSFQSYKEGSYISKNRVYVHYTTIIKLSRTSNLTAGASFGLVNQSYLANSATEAISKNSPDLSLGLGFESKQTQLLFSAKQVLNHSFKPLNTDLVLSRYYSLNFTHSIVLNQSWNMDFLVYGRLYKDQISELNSIFKFMYDDKFGLGFGATTYKGILVYGGVKLSENKSGRIDFNLHYTIGEFITKKTGSSTLELGFLFSKKT